MSKMPTPVVQAARLSQKTPEIVSTVTPFESPQAYCSRLIAEAFNRLSSSRASAGAVPVAEFGWRHRSRMSLARTGGAAVDSNLTYLRGNGARALRLTSAGTSRSTPGRPNERAHDILLFNGHVSLGDLTQPTLVQTSAAFGGM